MTDKDFIKLTEGIQELFNLAMWQNAREAMEIKDGLTEAMMGIYRQLNGTPSKEEEREMSVENK